MTRTQRRYGRRKGYKRIPIFKGESRHHRKPRSKKGSNHSDNISVVPKGLHECWHKLFSNLDPHTIADIISQKWIDPDYKFICVPVRRKLWTQPNSNAGVVG